MNRVKYIGICILALAWITLSIYMLASLGITLYNLLIVAISGAIVFVPLWKKYFRHD